ncbi:hypothetical protein Pfo_030118 [Paulownia fortunei]|nr:hypothetical protein Pfo_030118 [Paulownia fortunei]
MIIIYLFILQSSYRLICFSRYMSPLPVNTYCRDNWIYCQFHIRVKKSFYFADRLSDNWPICQIPDLCNCVQVYCEECEFDNHITFSFLFLVTSDMSVTYLCNQNQYLLVSTVNQLAAVNILAIQLAASSPPSSMSDLKTSDHESMCQQTILRIVNLVESLLGDLQESVAEGRKMESFQVYLTDLSWASPIVEKLENPRDFVYAWLETSANIVQVAQQVTAKVLEAIGYGTVIFSSQKMPSHDLLLKSDGELWQSLELTFLSMILTFPSADHAEMEQLKDKQIQYPDLTEAFEVGCYRLKVAM